eukprot:359211-Chlamydomonas_euryale.AAC.7
MDRICAGLRVHKEDGLIRPAFLVHGEFLVEVWKHTRGWNRRESGGVGCYAMLGALQLSHICKR